MIFIRSKLDTSNVIERQTKGNYKMLTINIFILTFTLFLMLVRFTNVINEYSSITTPLSVDFILSSAAFIKNYRYLFLNQQKRHCFIYFSNSFINVFFSTYSINSH